MAEYLAAFLRVTLVARGIHIFAHPSSSSTSKRFYPTEPKWSRISHGDPRTTMAESPNPIRPTMRSTSPLCPGFRRGEISTLGLETPLLFQPLEANSLVRRRTAALDASVRPNLPFPHVGGLVCVRVRRSQ